MKYYIFKRDSWLATLSVFLVIGIVLIIPLNLHFLDPIKLALTDIDFNDLSYASLKSHRSNSPDKKIVIVNIGNASRTEIATILQKVNAGGASTIGLDVFFESPKDHVADSALAATITHLPKVVLCNNIDFEVDPPLLHPNYFTAPASITGFDNLPGEKPGVIRYFLPFAGVKDSVVNSFAAAVVQTADAEKFNKLKNRSNTLEFINYRREADQYLLINYTDLLNNKVSLADAFNNKIVLIGLVDSNMNNIEDKYFTPLNEKFVGKSIPDMNGVVIHANIISMILEGDYVKRSPGWLNLFLAIFFTWIFMGYFIKNYIAHSNWFHLKLKIIQLLLSAVFIYMGILARRVNIEIDFSITLLGILLSVDVLYFYEAFVIWANKKFGFSHIFIKHHPDENKAAPVDAAPAE